MPTPESFYRTKSFYGVTPEFLIAVGCLRILFKFSDVQKSLQTFWVLFGILVDISISRTSITHGQGVVGENREKEEKKKAF